MRRVLTRSALIPKVKRPTKEMRLTRNTLTRVYVHIACIPVDVTQSMGSGASLP